MNAKNIFHIQANIEVHAIVIYKKGLL